MTEREREMAKLVGGREERTTAARCGVCKGKIIETTVYHPAIRDPHGPIGGPSAPIRRSWESKEYHCESCGISYKFIKEKP